MKIKVVPAKDQTVAKDVYLPNRTEVKKDEMNEFETTTQAKTDFA
jgi:hypothetical protein